MEMRFPQNKHYNELMWSGMQFKLPPVPTIEVNQVLWDSSSIVICTYQDVNDL